MELYDRLGTGYRERRRPDPRFAERVDAAFEGCTSVVNVGAGAGSYEPAGRTRVAVEPSPVMLAQRGAQLAPAVRGVAEHLPLVGHCVDGALAVLSYHHWTDPARGLRELRRVARVRVVVLTWFPTAPDFWLYDYVPELLELDRGQFPEPEVYAASLGPVRVEPLPVPHDCADGFLGAYWRRPEAYLDPGVRHRISSFHRVEGVEEGMRRLARDLVDGTWERRHGHLRALDVLDLGYALVVRDLSS